MSVDMITSLIGNLIVRIPLIIIVVRVDRQPVDLPSVLACHRAVGQHPVCDVEVHHHNNTLLYKPHTGKL